MVFLYYNSTKDGYDDMNQANGRKWQQHGTSNHLVQARGLTSQHHAGFAKFSYLHCLIIKIIPNVSWVSVCMCFCCVLCLAFCCVDYDRSCVHVCGVCRDQSDQGPVLWGVHACLNMDPARPIGHFRSPTHLLPTASSHLIRFRHMSLSEKLVWQTIQSVALASIFRVESNLNM